MTTPPSPPSGWPPAYPPPQGNPAPQAPPTAYPPPQGDPAYALVLVWAYAGILVNHLSSTGFNGAYPQVALTAAVAIALFLLAIPAALLRKKRASLA